MREHTAVTGETLCVCVCVRVCVRARARACVCVCVTSTKAQSLCPLSFLAVSKFLVRLFMIALYPNSTNL